MTQWQVLVTEADYEPWWFFEEWEETITETYEFQDKNEALEKYHAIASDWRVKYPEYAVKKDILLAAWNPEEVVYCEDCEDDIQNYHGLLLLADGEVYQPNAMEKKTYFERKEK
ncbi:Uncharacterized protein conserved in bacteria [Listeria grayi]|uniref:Uncharacterized protein conserved in bacteria n=1 Tax=Listeria grayi TaxID=1641 RepID=A0A378MA06_LISGR|nr:DUF1033 family protein [Listeria grayi]STY43161.1 Uncharacterized protein conserved in bacteria [Listeria grayi]